MTALAWAAWIAAVLAVWVVVALVAGLWLGAVIRRRDEQIPR